MLNPARKEKVLDVRKVRRARNMAGSQAYVTTIPAEWIKKKGLENGGTLLVKENAEGNIIIEKID